MLRFVFWGLFGFAIFAGTGAFFLNKASNWAGNSMFEELNKKPDERFAEAGGTRTAVSSRIEVINDRINDYTARQREKMQERTRLIASLSQTTREEAASVSELMMKIHAPGRERDDAFERFRNLAGQRQQQEHAIKDINRDIRQLNSDISDMIKQQQEKVRARMERQKSVIERVKERMEIMQQRNKDKVETQKDRAAAASERLKARQETQKERLRNMQDRSRN